MPDREADQMKIAVFGTGKKLQYEKENRRELFEKLNIVAYLDNKQSLWGETIDGIRIICPDKIVEMDYDKIVLMAEYVNDMKKQLTELGIPKEDILLWDEFLCLNRHGEIKEFGNWDARPQGREKILLVSVELNYNGGSIAIINAAKALHMRGYDVTLAAPGGNPALIEEITGQGICVAIVPAISYPRKEEMLWITQFTVVIVNVFQMIRCACVISGERPVMWWIHECSAAYAGIYPRIRDNQHEFDDEAAMKNVNVVTVSRIAQDNFNYYYPKKAKRILPYGISDSCAGKGKTDGGKHVYAVIGEIQARKAQQIFIDAIQMLDEKEKAGLEFWIIGKSGEGIYEKTVLKEAEECPEIKIWGELTQKQMQEAYQNIDVVVCCSLEETMSLTITEGMMNSKLCITTDATGVADYMKDKVNGLICRAGDAEDLCEKMRWIQKNPERHEPMKEAARKTYELYFSMETFGENLEREIGETRREWNRRQEGGKGGASVHIPDLQ